MRYDFGPVDALRGDTELSVLADKIGVAQGTVQRWRERGMEEHNADRVATAMGFHPWELWPEMLAVATAPVQRECETCGETFVLTRADKRFCSKRCCDQSTEAKARKAERARERYHTDAAHREAKMAGNQAYKATSRKAVRAGQNRWRAENRDHVNAYKRAWRARKRAEATLAPSPEDVG